MLDREGARLDQLGPVIEREERLEGFPLTLADRDQIDELPVVLRREADALLVRDPPQRGWVDGTAEVDVELSELVSEGMRQRLASLFARRRSADPPAAPRRGGTALRVLGPDRVPVIVGRCHGHDAVPDLGSAQLLLGGRARHVALEHDVAVVWRADLAPPVLGEQIEEPRDLRETLGLLGDIFAKPRRVGALALVLAVDLVPNGA
jgi:hypothetical protein